MSLVLVNTFLKVVETGSLASASRHLNVTQSTVTARLKTLEQEIGQPLLHRHKSGVKPTTAGFKFQRYAEAMSGLWRQALLETSLPGGHHGRLQPRLRGGSLGRSRASVRGSRA